MGTMCKCTKKIEPEHDLQKFEENCEIIEDILNKLNLISLHTGIWPQDYDNYSIEETFNKDHFTSQSKLRIIYKLDQPLIMKKNHIFTIQEYFAAKKIFKFLYKNKNN